MYMNNNTLRDGGKSQRQAAILEAVAQESLGTQNDLVGALKKRGISATQVSVSRDIAELGIIKAAGRYRTGTVEVAADPELPLRTSVRRVAPAGPNLIVVYCDAGSAQRVGLVLDDMGLEGLVGSIAGDDTVFLAVASGADNKRIIEFLTLRMQKI